MENSELLRMGALTEKTCCVLTVTRGSVDKHRKAMDYLERNAADGYVEDETVMRQEAVYWEVPR